MDIKVWPLGKGTSCAVTGRFSFMLCSIVFDYFVQR
jgi:hypothetical protein